MPGQPGNTNAATHYLRSKQANGLTLGRLPKRLGWIQRKLATFRRCVEAAVQANGGQLGLYEAALVNTAVRHELTAQLAQRWLGESPDMSPADRLSHARAIAQASESRDRALKGLKLDRQQIVDASDFYGRPWQPESQEQDSEATEAA